MPFTCSICGEESTRICVRCTKDTCGNHLCEKCLRCSDCCECQVALDDAAHPALAGSAHAMLPATLDDSGPDLEPDFDLVPEPEPEAEPDKVVDPFPGDETPSPDATPSGGGPLPADDPETYRP